jgi:hypothetical protein
MKLLSNILLILTLTLLSCADSNTKRTESLESDFQLLQNKADSLTKLLNEKETKTNYWFDSEFDGQKFTQLGIDDPTEYIEKSLREKPELIPLDAVLGGTMNFGKIQLLGNKWLITEFDDGHIYGTAIYKYKLKNNGELEFELLEYTDPAE